MARSVNPPPTLRARASRRDAYRHPVNRSFRDDAPLGARIADRVTDFMGSWTFILIQTVIVLVWVAGNIVLLFNFDPFPFILLNLAFSTQAAYAAPLILLAGNRQSLRDRMTLEHTASEADKEDRQNQRLLEGTKELAEGNREILKQVEALEQRILQLESSIIQRLDAR
ncbi:MAG TPA: DUF1003 domain-containing protein [Candidatus Limnocylindrales bacterium]|nr:DUF1003 domain-containing protein [Candidatus Limnocylindrales bacterium]